MAFEALDETKPAGPDERRFGDDVIRQHVRAIRQRFASFFIDVDTDPLVPRALSVPGSALVDLSVTTGKHADANVTQAKLAKPSVGTPELIDLSVSTGKHADASVTQAKLAKPAVGTPELMDNSATSAKISVAAILPGHVGAGAFGFDSVNSVAGYRVNGAAPANQLLIGDGVWATFRALVQADLPVVTQGASVYLGANMDLVVATPTPIPWDNEVFDNGGFHDNAVNPTRLTVPAGMAGRYLLLATVCFVGFTANVFIYARKNGVTDLTRCDRHTTNTSVESPQLQHVIDLAVGDYIEVYAQTDTAGNPDIFAGIIRTHLSLTRML